MADYDLTSVGDSATVNGLFFEAATSITSGTGGYFTFLAIQDNDGTEEGYNHDEPGGTTVLDTDNSKTRSLQVNQLEVVNVGGVDSYILRLDMNEPGNATGTSAPIDMLEFKLYTSNTVAASGDFNANQDGAGDGGLGAGFTKFYDLDSDEDNTVHMQDLSSGSGGDDYQVVIPVSMVTPGTYLTLYWKFDDGEAGFEEARALTVPFVAAPAIDIEKYVSVDGGSTWLDADVTTGPYALTSNDIQFKFVVENIGNVDLTSVVVSDSDFDLDGVGLDGTWNIGDLAIGGLVELIYDLDETTEFTIGQHTNTATATGDFGVTQVSDADDANYFGATPSIDVEKEVSVDGGTTWVDADTTTGPFALATDDIKFRFIVTNDGNVDLTNVVVSDSDFGLDGGTTWNIGALAAGASTSYLIYDLDETTEFTIGQHTNTATATGDFGVTQVSDADDANYFGATPSIDVEKEVSVDGGTTWVDADTTTGPFALATDDIKFRFIVTNDGNVDLTNVVVSDSDFGLDGGTTWNIGALAAGASTSYLIYDLDETTEFTIGQHTNTATATGDFGVTQVSDADDANYFGATPSIDVEKEVSVDGGTTWVDADTTTGPFALATDDIKFRFIVTNDGNVDLTNVVVSDSDFGLDGGTTWNIGALAAGASTSYLIYDLDETTEFTIGQHTNTATATGDFGVTQVSDADDANYFGATPSIDVEKEVSVDGGTTWVDADTTTGPFALATDDIKFRFIVTNDGNVDLTNVVVSDSDFGLDGGTTWNIGALAAGASTSYLIYDLDETTEFTIGQHTNTATATGDFGATQVSDADDAHYWGVVGEGLSHGYWKNHGPDDGRRDDWDIYAPDTNSFETFFGIDADTWYIGTKGNKAILDTDVTFEEALGLPGGGYQALAREAVAAVLNAADEDISYGYNEATIIAMVQTAFATGEFEYYKNLLENENTSGDWMIA